MLSYKNKNMLSCNSRYYFETHININNLVILSEKIGIWDLRGNKIWDLGFEGSKI